MSENEQDFFIASLSLNGILLLWVLGAEYSYYRMKKLAKQLLMQRGEFYFPED